MLEGLDHSETLTLLNELSDDNALLKWWEMCYGSPKNPEFMADGRPYPTWQREYYDAGAYARQRMIIAANGVGKCVSYQTLIDTPSGPKRVGELFEAGMPFEVCSWDGGAVTKVAEAPFAKGLDHCYRVLMTDGRWFECSGRHRVMFCGKYVFFDELRPILPYHDPTIAESGPLVRVSGVHRCWQKARDFLVDCLDGLSFGDARLLPAPGIWRPPVPLQDDVPEHILVSLRGGATDNVSSDNRRRLSRRRSTYDFYCHIPRRAWGMWVDQVSSTFAAPKSATHRVLRPFLLALGRSDSLGLPRALSCAVMRLVSRAFRHHSIASCVSIESNEVLSYHSIGVQPIFDFAVPETHCYLAAGVVHHNSQSVCAEAAAHFTGEYPDWWQGERFDYGGWECWIGSIDNDMQKRGPQRALLGRNLEDQLGKGLIPAGCILDHELRQAGVKSVVDTMTIKHASGNPVTVKWLTFEQGWRKWQSGDPKIILWDEEPDENVVDQAPILSEALTRLVRNNGIFMVGYTPLLGETQLTEHFMDSEDSRVYYITAGWDDAPHMSEEDKELIRSQYRAHEVEARTMGIPMMGEGRVLTTPEAQYMCDPVRIPDHWSRIKGIDFGIAHPAATVDLAHDRDNDVIYITKVWKKKDQRLGMHAQQINAADDWIPVAWPHDGEKRDQDSGKQFHKLMRDKYHVKMLSQSARYKADKGGAQAQWPIIDTVNERMASGRLKVFRTCVPWVKEARSYHTKDGLIVAKKDDLLKASFYGIMMIRFARSATQGRGRKRQQGAAFTTAVG